MILITRVETELSLTSCGGRRKYQEKKLVEALE